jgi:hypothetical protein
LEFAEHWDFLYTKDVASDYGLSIPVKENMPCQIILLLHKFISANQIIIMLLPWQRGSNILL